MVFVKVVKNKAYFSRFQTKYRRRREGKTDFRARRRMVTQDKNKYNSPKYRLITNKDVTCQVAYSKVEGDYIVACAYAHELPLYGAKVGLTSYAGCYATGLLCARRLLKKYKLDSKYEGQKEANGEYYEPEADGDGPNPFRAVLDLGLARATTGANIFGALKGCVDGGVNVPHGDKRFPGFNKSKGELDSEAHRKRILGVHVAEYQSYLKKENPQQYDKLFSRYKASGINPDGIEGMWKKTHAAIRADPTKRVAKKPTPAKHKVRVGDKKRTTADRLHVKRQKKEAIMKKLLAAAEE